MTVSSAHGNVMNSLICEGKINSIIITPAAIAKVKKNFLIFIKTFIWKVKAHCVPQYKSCSSTQLDALTCKRYGGFITAITNAA